MVSIALLSFMHNECLLELPLLISCTVSDILCVREFVVDRLLSMAFIDTSSSSNVGIGDMGLDGLKQRNEM